jgi:hypothetical protein
VRRGVAATVLQRKYTLAAAKAAEKARELCDEAQLAAQLPVNVLRQSISVSFVGIFW